mgnify:CR=1 FL=1
MLVSTFTEKALAILLCFGYHTSMESAGSTKRKGVMMKETRAANRGLFRKRSKTMSSQKVVFTEPAYFGPESCAFDDLIERIKGLLESVGESGIVEEFDDAIEREENEKNPSEDVLDIIKGEFIEEGITVLNEYAADGLFFELDGGQLYLRKSETT